MTPDLGIMTEEALAELLGLELATMANRRTKGELPAHIKPGRRVLYRVETVRRWLEAQEERPTPRLRPPAGARIAVGVKCPWSVLKKCRVCAILCLC